MNYIKKQIYNYWLEKSKYLNNKYENSQFKNIDLLSVTDIVNKFIKNNNLNSFNTDHPDKLVSSESYGNEIVKIINISDSDDLSNYFSAVDEIIKQQQNIINKAEQHLKNISIIYKIKLQIIDAFDMN